MGKKCEIKDEGLTPEKLAMKHSLFLGTIEKELEKGIEIEYEHTDCKDMAKKIAMAHIDEFPDYYSNKRYGLIANEKKLEKVHEERDRTSVIGNFFNDIEKAKDFNELEKLKRVYHQVWFNRLPDPTKKKVAKKMMDKIGYINKNGNLGENIKTKLRDVSEDTGLAINDYSPTTLDYNIKAAGKIVGEIKLNTRHKDFGKDTMEIVDLKLDPNQSDIKSTLGALQAIWKSNPSAMRIVVTPSDDTLSFWEKLGFNRLNNDYLIIDRAHN